MLASGFLDAVWMPDEATRALRHWIARRAQLLRQRTRAKNEIHAVLVRTLTVGPGVSDLFGKAGRAWLARVELPVDERVTGFAAGVRVSRNERDTRLRCCS